MGNARTFLINHLLASRESWRVLMRVEDLDSPRVKGHAAEQMLDELRWLQLEWSGEIVYQSRRIERHRRALDRLIEAGVAYPCTCTRKDIHLAAGAPHREDGLRVYPGTCRGRYDSAEQASAQTGRPVAWRVRVDGVPIDVADRFHGPRSFNLADVCGDFVIFKSDTQAAYQLAVVVDDADAGVDRIVRGDDLLDSAARQIHLRRLLGIAGEVRYWHVPLVVGPDGRRLAKRHGDTRLATYRSAGMAARRVLGLLGFWCGILGHRRVADMEELVERFDPARLPAERIVLADADDAFLRGG